MTAERDYHREWVEAHRAELRAYNREWMRAYRAGLKTTPVVPVAACPECGAKLGKTQQESYDDHERYFRLRECRDCGLRYATVEITVPGSFYDWADQVRYIRTVAARRARGYQNANQGRYRRPRPKLILEARVIKAHPGEVAGDGGRSTEAPLRAGRPGPRS